MSLGGYPTSGGDLQLKETVDNTDSGLQVNEFSEDVQSLVLRFGISADDVRSCHAAFQGADRDKRGYIGMMELRVLLERLSGQSLTPEEFQDIALRFDRDGDTHINFAEFLVAFCQSPHYKARHLETMCTSMVRESLNAVTSTDNTPNYKVRYRGVAKRKIMDWIVAEEELMSSCKQLPWTILIVLFYWIAVSSHEQAWVLHAVDQAITWDIEENANFAFSGITPFENGRMGHKNFGDVNTVADFYSWFSLGLVPMFWASGWDISEARTNTVARCTSPAAALKDFGYEDSLLQGLPKAEFDLALCPERATVGPKDWFSQGGKKRTPTYLTYNPVVGGMRLRQERTASIDCKLMDAVSKLYSGRCVPRTPDYWLHPDGWAAFVIDENLVNQPGGETKYLMSGISQEDVRTQLKAMEDQVWFGPETAKIEMLFVTYNPHIQAITGTFIFLHQNRAGHFHKRIEPVSVWLDPYHGSWHCYFFDVVWCLLILKIIYEESMDIRANCRRYGIRKGLYEYIAFANAVDWINVLFSLVIITMWITHLNNMDELKTLLGKASYEVPGSWENAADRERFFQAVFQTMVQTIRRNGLLAAYPFIVTIRLFKSLSAQPRLALVTRTLAKAGIDLVHFLFVFACVFALFAISAEIFYGQELEEFATFPRACDSCFHLLMGDFDWGELRDQSRHATMVFFWIFMWMVQVVMLNMLLAIIMDVYTEVRGSIGRDAPTLWHQAYDIMRRWWDLQKGQRVPLPHVYDSLEACSLLDDSRITVSILLANVPGINEKQCLRILLQTIKVEDDQVEAESQSEANKTLMVLSEDVKSLKASSKNVMKLGDMSTDLLKREIRTLSSRLDKLMLCVPGGAFSDDLASSAAPRNPQPQASVGQASIEAQQVLLQQHAEMVNKRCDRLEGMLAEVIQQMGQVQRSAPQPQTSLPVGYGASFQEAPQGLGSFCSISRAPPRSYPPHSMV